MTNDVIFYEEPRTSIGVSERQGLFISLLIRSGVVKSESAARAMLLTGGAVCITLALFIFLRTVNEPGIIPDRDIPPISRTSLGQ